MDTSPALLGLLDSKPGHGYDLKHDYDRWFGARKPLAFGQVYATLARFIRDGLIVAAGEEQGAGPDRKRYAITPAGHEHVERWMFTADDPGGFAQPNLFAKTVIALLLDADADRLLDLQRAAHMERMRELTRMKHDGALTDLLLADHELFHIEADLRWIDVTSARLAELRATVRA